MSLYFVMVIACNHAYSFIMLALWFHYSFVPVLYLFMYLSAYIFIIIMTLSGVSVSRLTIVLWIPVNLPGFTNPSACYPELVSRGPLRTYIRLSIQYKLRANHVSRTNPDWIWIGLI